VDLKLGDELVKARISPTFKVYPRKKAWIKFNMERTHIMDKRTEKAAV